jgi:hypothetical protein
MIQYVANSFSLIALMDTLFAELALWPPNKSTRSSLKSSAG